MRVPRAGVFGLAGLAAVVFSVAALTGPFSSPDADARKSKMSKYEWTSTNSAPEAYPIELLSTNLQLADGETYYIPDRRAINHGWGKAGATHLVGEAQKALPERLQAIWFSYTEDKFYAIDVELPLAAIEEAFETGIESPERGERHNYDRAVFGFGPEGEGAVWLSAQSNMVDLFRFKGAETAVEWSQMVSNSDISRPDFISMILEESLKPGARGAYVQGTWPRWQQRWDWSLGVNGEGETSLVQITYLNGEVLHVFSDGSPNFTHPAYAAPHKVLMHWTGAAGQKRLGTITFDPDETLQAFEKLEEAGGPISVVVNVSESSNALAVEIMNPSLVISLERAKTEVYSR